MEDQSIYISGIGVNSPWGNNVEDFFKGFRNEQSEKKPLDEFLSYKKIESTEITSSMLCYTPRIDYKKYIKPLRLRKYDEYSKAGIAVSKLAIDDSSVEPNPDNTALFCTNDTISGLSAKFFGPVISKGPGFASPRLFPGVSANSASCNISIETGLRGPTYNFGGLYGASFHSLYNAKSVLNSKKVNSGLAVSIDLFSKIQLEAFSRFGAYKKNEDSERGIIPGEGSVAVYLTDENKDSYGKINKISQMSCYETKTYHWPKSKEKFAKFIKDFLEGEKVDIMVSLINGEEKISTIEKYTLENVAKLQDVKIVNVKGLIGESTSATIFSLVSALSFPKGTKILIPVIASGGVFGALLVESFGKGSNNNDG